MCLFSAWEGQPQILVLFGAVIKSPVLNGHFVHQIRPIKVKLKQLCFSLFVKHTDKHKSVVVEVKSIYLDPWANCIPIFCPFGADNWIVGIFTGVLCHIGRIATRDNHSVTSWKHKHFHCLSMLAKRAFQWCCRLGWYRTFTNCTQCHGQQEKLQIKFNLHSGGCLRPFWKSQKMVDFWVNSLKGGTSRNIQQNATQLTICTWTLVIFLQEPWCALSREVSVTCRYARTFSYERAAHAVFLTWSMCSLPRNKLHCRECWIQSQHYPRSKLEWSHSHQLCTSMTETVWGRLAAWMFNFVQPEGMKLPPETTKGKIIAVPGLSLTSEHLVPWTSL